MSKKDAKISYLETTPPGFRKGVTKESILKSMTEGDWQHIHDIKEAENRKANNEIAYKFYVLSDQSVQEMNRIKREIGEFVANTLDQHRTMMRNKVDISIGKTTQKLKDGTPMEVRDLELSNMYIYGNIQTTLDLLRSACSRLYKFVNTMRFDKQKIITEEEYNAIITDAMDKLKETPYRLI